MHIVHMAGKACREVGILEGIFGCRCPGTVSSTQVVTNSSLSVGPLTCHDYKRTNVPVRQLSGVQKLKFLATGYLWHILSATWQRKVSRIEGLNPGYIPCWAGALRQLSSPP